jgi:hypothetical protein
VFASIDPSWRRKPLTRTMVPLTSCAHDNPLSTVVLSIQIVVPATEKVITGHDPLTATMVPSTSVSRRPAFADTMALVAAADDRGAAGEIAWISRPWQAPTAMAATVDHIRTFKGISALGQAWKDTSNARATEDRAIMEEIPRGPLSCHRGSTTICIR